MLLILNKSRVANSKTNSLTPDQKLSVQLSNNNKRDSDQYGLSKYTKATGRSDIEGNETFITTNDYQSNLHTMDERISKLENLVWSLYKELNGKIENANANMQLQIEDTNNTTQQVFAQLSEEIGGLREDMAQISYPLRKSDDEGYDGSAEEYYNQEEEGEGEEYNLEREEENYIMGSLDRVDEELYSNDYSHEGKVEHSRHSVDRTDPQVEISYDKLPKEYHLGIDLEEEHKNFKLAQKYSSPHFKEDQKESSSEGNKENSSPVEGSEEVDLEYYFSCHERMVHEYNIGMF